MTLDELLAKILNPNPGGNMLAQAGAGYLPQTGLSPDMVARQHAMSGITAPQAGAMPSPPPQAAPAAQTAPAPSVGYSQPSGGGFLSGLFGGGRNADIENQTAQWLVKQGYDPEVARGLAADKEAMQKIFIAQGAGKKRDTATIGTKLVDTQTGEVIGDYGTQSGVFRGDSVEAQALNGLVDSGQLTKEQAQQLAAGKMVTNPADGSIMFVTPQGIFSKPANGGPAQPIQPQARTPAQSVAPSANAPISTQSGIPGTGTPPGSIQVTGPKPSGKKTESEERYSVISSILLNEVPTLGTNFKALADPTGQLLGKIPGDLGNMWQSEEYQRAASAVKTTISNVLYALSGASSNPGEVINQIAVLTPALGDKPGVIADKFQRFKVYVRAVASGTGDPKLKQMVDEAITKMDAPDVGAGGTNSSAPAGDANLPPVPADVDPKLWKYMTPEQRALWQ